MTRDRATEQDRAAQEPDRLDHDQCNTPNVDGLAGLRTAHDASNDGEYDEPEHVIDHRSAKYDAARRRIDATEVLEHACGDTDGGRTEDRADEQVDVPRHVWDE